MVDEEDSIVEEIPVFLSKSLANSLYVFQYPNKAPTKNTDNINVINCCVKPITQQIKVDLALNTASTHYDAFKGEQFALAADGKHPTKNASNPNDRPSFRSGRMDKQSYVSSKPVENVERYCVGVLQDRELHLTPLKGIVQLRPSLYYFDKQDKRKKTEQKAEDDADNDEEEVQQVTVKFARTENEKVKKAREKSWQNLSSIAAEEPWCETFWYERSSHRSELERQKMFAQQSIMTAVNALSLTPKEYLDNLMTNEVEAPEKPSNGEEPVVPATKVVSMCQLKTLPLLEQIRVILKNVRVITFTKLMELLRDNTLTADKVLRTLPSAGVLINGNWTVQSEILYPKDSMSGINGIVADVMARARDYVLFQFTKQEFLSRKKIAIYTQLPIEEVKEIMMSVARLRPDKGWELLLPPDHTFEKKFPEIVQRQEMYWKAKEERFAEMEEDRARRVRKRSMRDSKSESK